MFDVENYDKEGKSYHRYYTPRNILSAYAQIYFEDILNSGENKRNHEKAFNATVMSLAWTQHALERFHDGSTRGREQEG
ncbi:MAG: hypothetical protein HXS54_02530 [Theionarchaea archaeon]|nr:hypothetical protein [Theionarchaea archaeon]